MFVGKIKLSDNTMMFRLDDYELIISNSEGQWTSWNDIKAIINDGWIKLEDFSENVIYAYIEDVEFLNLYEYKCNLQFYVIDWHRKGKKHTLEFDHIWIKSDCLDYYLEMMLNTKVIYPILLTVGMVKKLMRTGLIGILMK